MGKPVDKALINKFINNACTPEEVFRVREFLQQPESDRIFEEILNERWASAEGDEPVNEVQMQDWEHKFNQRTTQVSGETNYKIKTISWVKYAAVWAVIILTAGSFSWYQLQKKNMPVAVAMLESHTEAGKLLKIQLPDGTIVYLNAASRLQYPEKFDGKTRTVILQGEAFFEVRHDKLHPFMVKADQLNVHVLGTSFNIRSYQNDQDVAVTVVTGKVGVTVPSFKDGQTNFLLPDKELTYTKSSGKLDVKTVHSADSKAWETASFVFNYETLDNITKRLSRWYDVSFVCTNPSLLHKRFKLKLKNEALKTVMESLSSSGRGFKYQIKDKQVIIK